MTRDYSLVYDDDTGMTAHRPDCPTARAAADRGKPVMTLFDCSGDLPKDVKLHTCLQQKEVK